MYVSSFAKVCKLARTLLAPPRVIIRLESSWRSKNENEINRWTFGTTLMDDGRARIDSLTFIDTPCSGQLLWTFLTLWNWILFPLPPFPLPSLSLFSPFSFSSVYNFAESKVAKRQSCKQCDKRITKKLYGTFVIIIYSFEKQRWTSCCIAACCSCKHILMRQFPHCVALLPNIAMMSGRRLSI